MGETNVKVCADWTEAEKADFTRRVRSVCATAKVEISSTHKERLVKEAKTAVYLVLTALYGAGMAWFGSETLKGALGCALGAGLYGLVCIVLLTFQLRSRK